MWFVNIFSLSEFGFSSSSQALPQNKRVSHFYQFFFSFFPLTAYVFGIKPKNFSLTLGPEDFLPYFPLKIFIILHFALKSMIHLELIFRIYVRFRLFLFFVCLFMSIHLGVVLKVNPYSNLLKWVF